MKTFIVYAYRKREESVKIEVEAEEGFAAINKLQEQMEDPEFVETLNWTPCTAVSHPIAKFCGEKP